MTTSESEQALKRLAAVTAQIRELETDQIALVAAARAAGATWEEIGGSVGMARTNANRKFKPLLLQEEGVRDGGI